MSEPRFKFELGVKVKDVVTGFSGVVMSRTQHLTQCNQYGISPAELTKEGKRPDWEWFDENRLIETGGKKIVLPNQDRGGPIRKDEVSSYR